ncbi:MAG: protein kinase [Balneolaceae bacterium]|nr:protein kinase [Balneolaceae bacterium]
MQKEQWLEIEKYFHQALELSKGEREVFFRNLKSSNPETASSVKKLLKSHFESEHFLQHPVLDDLISIPNQRIGPWKIIRQIGKGGMSIVYLAERADGRFSREVAVKFLYGLDNNRDMQQRMKTEQSILAQLNHPNICKLLDAGIHQNRPYFIMEYIDGPVIDNWCISKNLSVRERLSLFMQVCDAVSYAHQRLIVHRDIKPSNILVDSSGTVKLLDFGIAKIIGDQEKNRSVTLTGNHVMTPEYASPEQIQNHPITTATDVYALGQLLFLLLTDTLPFDFTKKSTYEISKTISEIDPVKPSQKITETALEESSERTTLGGFTRKQAAKQLRGDLDNIVLKALRKDPQRRYQSAENLKADILNYTENRPITARPESRIYRTKKFVQRYKTSVITALVAAVLLISTTIFAVWQAAEANSQREVAEMHFENIWELANSLIFDLHDAVSTLPGSTPARELIVEQALDYLDQLSDTDNATPDLLLDLARAYQKVGDVQGNPTNNNLGDHQEALLSYNKAIEIANTVLIQDSSNTRAREIMAMIYEKMGDVEGVLGELESAEQSQVASLNLYQSIAEQFPDDPSRQFSYAVSLIKLGDLMGNPNFSNLENPEESHRLYREAETILLPIYNRNPQNTRYIKYLGIVYERMGTMFEYEDRLEEAAWCFEESMKLRTQLVELEPMNTEAVRDKAVAHEKMGHILKQSHKLDEALTQYLESLEMFSWLAEIDPQNSQAQQSVAISYIHLGDLYYHPDDPSFDDPAQSREYFKQSKEILLDLAENDTANTRTDFLIGLVNRRLDAIEN